MPPPRVAYFPDSYHEINGVAHTSRNFAAYAGRHDLPFLCVRASLDMRGARRTFDQAGQMRSLELRRSSLAVRMEKDLQFDPLFWRHGEEISAQLRAFAPDIIHITGPSELGIFGAWFAWKHGIRLAASWHTNVHEYAGRRLSWLTRILPETTGARLEHTVESAVLAATLRFYRLAGVLFAPNVELCRLIAESAGKPCHLMQRGVDTDLFSPVRRTRPAADSTFVLGYVGRLSIEKNVALLVRIERELHALGITNVRLLIVGHGDEEEMLRRELQHADMPGVLRGDALAEAYANMDLLVFPSHTDTFGNVVLEALASGVPAIVTPDGGPKFIVRDGETGFVVPDPGFVPAIAGMERDRKALAAMGLAARSYALSCSWDAVFDRVYAAYDTVLTANTGAR
ncbi:MAG: glycosyltransferase family 1 protein [Acidobacteriaceae bacterium]